MTNDQISWKRMRFKKNKVWLATDPDGTPVVNEGKVLIKYQLDQEHEYWVHEKGVRPIESTEPEEEISDREYAERPEAPSELRTEPLDEEACPDTVRIYTDGASSGNPGPSGIGVLLQYGSHEKEISKYIGIATNNIAELEAIRAGLSVLKKTDLPVRVFTDSKYAYGVLMLGWKAKKNLELVRSIKKTISKVKDLKIIKVKGHAGIDGNERADYLATLAIKNRK
ncbi:ribonuclease HI [Thermodesulfobacteriota bacterium]